MAASRRRVEFRLDTTASERVFRQLETKAPTAIARSLNRAMVAAKTVMVRAVVNDLGMPTKRVTDRIATVPAYPEPSGLVSKLVASAAPIRLSEFNPKGPLPTRGRGRGVTVELKVWGQRRRYPKLFLVRLTSGHLGVYGRDRTTTRKSQGAWSKNLPIVERHGPSMARVAGRFSKAAAERGRELLVKTLEHEIHFALRNKPA
jgi:hypothetical protein